MSIHEQISNLESILRELAAIDFGYPLGDNLVAPPGEQANYALAEAGLDGISGLLDLYSSCNGISMPDVHNGYFIKPLHKLLEYKPASEPRTVLLDAELEVIPLGSTGGGDLFVVERKSGRVLLLPPGPLHDGLYDGRQTNVKVVAEGIPQFLDELICDVEAFVHDKQGHRYLSDQ